MVVDAAGTLPLPWLAPALATALATHRGHALLVHGAPGVGALPFALVLAQAWLCEDGAPQAPRPCGRCGSCRLVQSHLHPDLFVLLPTVRSRCQRLPLAAPAPAAAASWLLSQGVTQPEVLLAASSGRPLDALALARAGIDAEAWSALPAAVAGGRAAALAGWPVPQAVDALQKLCHDAMARAGDGPARYFPTDRVPAGCSWPALASWSRELVRIARHEDHPWQEGLMIDALVALGRLALATPVPGGAAPRRGFVTLDP